MIVQKVFMIQDHQLRKWGKLTGWLMGFFAVFCFGTAALLYRLVGEMRTGMGKLAEEDQGLINSASVPAGLRSSLLETTEEHMAINGELLDALGAVPIGLVGVGFLAIFAGLLSVRAGELANAVGEKA